MWSKWMYEILPLLCHISNPYIHRKHRDLVLGANPSDSECFMDYPQEGDTADPAGDVAHELPKHNVVESVSHKTEDLK